MANYKGWDGYFLFGGSAFGGTLNSWSTDESVGEVDVSAFDATTDSRERTYEPGLKEVTASISGFANIADQGQKNIKHSLDNGVKYYGYFFLENGKYFFGEAFVTGRTIDHNFDDSVAEISVDFRVTGGLTEKTI